MIICDGKRARTRAGVRDDKSITCVIQSGCDADCIVIDNTKQISYRFGVGRNVDCLGKTSRIGDGERAFSNTSSLIQLRQVCAVADELERERIAIDGISSIVDRNTKFRCRVVRVGIGYDLIVGLAASDILKHQTCSRSIE